MRKEIDKAVETFHRIALGTRQEGNKVVADGKLASFVTVLTELLLARVKDNWYPCNPNRGSGYRCLRINGQCIDPTVIESLKRAKIELSSLNTTEVTIWVDPGVVSVRIGEEGSIGSEIVDEEVFRQGNKSKTPAKRPNASTSDEDEAYSSRSPSPANSPEPPKSLSPPAKPNSSAQFHRLNVTDYSPRSTSSPLVSYQPRQLQQRRNTPPRMMGKGLSPSTQPSPSHAGISSGHIPPQSYSQPRILFPQESPNGSFRESQYRRDGLASANIMARQVMPMRGPGLMQGNFSDIPIPAMA